MLRWLVVFSFLGCAASEIMHGGAVLEGQGNGYALASISLNGVSLTYNVVATGLTGPITKAHFHIGPRGISGGVVYGICDPCTGNYLTGTLANISMNMADFMNERMYINLHTAQYPTGEIRGQVMVPLPISAPYKSFSVLSSPTLSGHAVAAFNLSEYKGMVNYSIVATGLTGPITKAHFHVGSEGVSGPVVYPICDPCPVDRIFGNVSQTIQYATQLATSGLYVNLHTAANPTGEVRGQVMLGPAKVLTCAYFSNQTGATKMQISGTAYCHTAIITCGFSTCAPSELDGLTPAQQRLCEALDIIAAAQAGTPCPAGSGGSRVQLWWGTNHPSLLGFTTFSGTYQGAPANQQVRMYSCDDADLCNDADLTFPPVRCRAVDVAPAAGFCAGLPSRVGVCATDQLFANRLARQYLLGVETLTAAIAQPTCLGMIGYYCSQFDSSVREGFTCDKGMLCNTSSGWFAQLGFLSQCEIDSDCNQDSPLGQVYASQGPPCCDEVLAELERPCNPIPPSGRVKLGKSCLPRGMCVSQKPLPASLTCLVGSDADPSSIHPVTGDYSFCFTAKLPCSDCTQPNSGSNPLCEAAAMLEAMGMPAPCGPSSMGQMRRVFWASRRGCSRGGVIFTSPTATSPMDYRCCDRDLIGVLECMDYRCCDRDLCTAEQPAPLTCARVSVSAAAGVCAAAPAELGVCTADAAMVAAALPSWELYRMGIVDGAASNCQMMVGSFCMSLGTQAKADAACSAASLCAPASLAAPLFYSQCDADTPCKMANGSPLFPVAPRCCNEVRAAATALCVSPNLALAAAMSGCSEDSAICVSQAAAGGGGGSTGACEAPVEACCTRTLNDPRRRVVVELPSPVAVSSVTVWETMGAPLLLSDAQMQDAQVTVMDGVTSTTCATWFDAATDAAQAAAGSPYRRWALICGSVGTKVSISLPHLFPADGPAPPSGSVAVKLCTVPAGAAPPRQPQLLVSATRAPQAP